MESPADRRMIEELLSANRDLLASNRQIAETLASFERQYASQLEQNKIHMLYLSAHTSWLNSPLWEIGMNTLWLITLISLITIGRVR